VPLQRLSHITSDLQDGVMKTRMQPIGNAWAKLPRLVRDLARELGKKIELDMRGAETELDRQVLELIKDPLTHMVRNSADHGLESPRSAAPPASPRPGASC
jgi:two-component system, chemotaxis family, sensor kinase CheA